MRSLIKLFVLQFLLTHATYGAIVISEIELASSGSGRIELVNTGSTTIDLSNYWWCNRVSGSPFYSTVGSASELYTGPGTTDSNAALTVEAGERIVLTIPASFVPTGAGELGLYSTNSFGSSTAIVDYLEWGGEGVRDSVAATAGIWEDTGASSDYIDVSTLTTSYTIQLNVDANLNELAGDSAADYVVRPSSFGAAAVPEPSPFLMLSLVGLCAVGWRRLRHNDLLR